MADVTLETILARVLGVEPSEIDDRSNARNTRNWDSMRHIEVLLAVETAFGVQFSIPEITGMQNVGDIRRLLIAKGVLSDFAELRDGVEKLQPEDYERLSYYERWAAAVAYALIDKGVIAESELRRTVEALKAEQASSSRPPAAAPDR